MIKNWALLSLRRFFRNKVNSFINVAGLALGMMVFLFIFIYVRHELSYDNFHTDPERIFRLIKENPPGDGNYQGKRKQAVLQAPLADVIKAQMTGVERVTRMANWGAVVVEADGKTFYEDSYHAADPDLFGILTFTPVDGTASQALQKPNTVAISESLAIKYFGTAQAVGKVLDYTGTRSMGSFTVDFVFKDFPSNSSFQFGSILRFVDFVKAVQSSDLENWGNHNYNFLLKTAPMANASDIENQIKQFFVTKFGDAYDHEAEKTNYYLEPLADIYLRSDVNFSNTPKNDISRLYMLATIGIFVLAVAGINYVNLTTARSVRRAKEVGIRKVVGANKRGLVIQFLTDALAIGFISMMIAVLALWTLFPSYREFIGKQLPLSLGDPLLLFCILAIPALLGMLAGIYPALVLSSFKPVKVLKGNFSRSTEGNTLRDFLTSFQFAISGVLIISVLIIGRQLNFIETHNPGYDREHILKLSLRDEGVREKKDVLVEELRKHPNIVSASITSYFPNAVNTQQSREWRSAAGSNQVSFYTINADYNYVDLFNIQIIKGRNFSPDIPSDRNAFLINETAAKSYGWDDPVGMEFTGERTGEPGDTVHIIGVIKDMHISSYRSPIAPFRIGLSNKWSGWVAIKIKPNDIPATMSYIEENYKKLATTKFPYSIAFFDEEFGNTYKTDRQLGKLISLFSIMAVIIACLGLYGLSTHTVAQRLKEIGIRKILGAEPVQIIYMLSSKVVVLVVIAFVICSPVAYYVMDQWLQTFAYHVELPLGAFVLTALTMVIIALGTIGWQTWRAAILNPSEVLRIE